MAAGVLLAACSDDDGVGGDDVVDDTEATEADGASTDGDGTEVGAPDTYANHAVPPTAVDCQH